MNIRTAHRTALALLLCPAAFAIAQDITPVLRPPSAFDSIKNQEERSASIFVEAGKVINSPRCLNCHPSTRQPTQGEDRHPHIPAVNAGQAGVGQPGLLCVSCHQTQNVAAAGTKFRAIPGHAHWSLAPESMAWQGKSLGEICNQLKDMSRNGNRTMLQISEHMGKDSLVGWGWHPGAGRTPAPGTQKAFGELIQAWIDTGASCPR